MTRFFSFWPPWVIPKTTVRREGVLYYKESVVIEDILTLIGLQTARGMMRSKFSKICKRGLQAGIGQAPTSIKRSKRPPNS
jgi:hypothetical protein